MGNYLQPGNTQCRRCQPCTAKQQLNNRQVGVAWTCFDTDFRLKTREFFLGTLTDLKKKFGSINDMYFVLRLDTLDKLIQIDL